MGVICGTTDVSEAVHGLFRHLPSGTVQRRAPLSRDMSAIKLVAVSAVGIGCGGERLSNQGWRERLVPVLSPWASRGCKPPGDGWWPERPPRGR